MQGKITIRDLRVSFTTRNGPVEALDSFSLTIPDGELACVVGPSGCGKTTLLRVLAKLQVPTGGSAVVRSDDPARPTVGMVFQNGGIFPWQTVAENVGYGLRMRGVPPAERQPIVRRWISEIGLERFADAYPAQLSGGMQQRVGLARAFAYDPEILLMDEPFAALDAQNRLLLQQTLLRQWEGNARTVLFVTHGIDEALTLGDRIYVMSARPGRLLATFDVPFERPRDAGALRGDPRFSKLYAAIWDVLRDEVERSREAELAEGVDAT
ncbi:MAG TPA: ABC transporter ATP-binding protein [Roseiflexaceae bacterium]|nr:ABC transporter ATP-binding protein [Roseiflexaceae bacterium]HMP40409.1 ABC transporter ATP-binding protein [Roseiflexaceae bacterium]